MLHHHPARVASQPLRRFCRNARSVLHHRLAGRLGVVEHRRVHVNHHLVAFAGGAGIDAVVQRRFGEQRQRVGLLLLERRLLLFQRGHRRPLAVHGVGSLAPLLVQHLARRGQRAQE